MKILNIIKEDKICFSEKERESFFKEKSYNERKNELNNSLKDLGIKEIFNKKDNPKPICLEERINKINSKPIKIYYKTFYRLVSIGVHSSPDILNRYLIFDEYELVKDIHWGPKAENCEIYTILSAINFMIINIEYIHNYFEHPEKDIISKYEDKLKKIGDKYHYFL